MPIRKYWLPLVCCASLILPLLHASGESSAAPGSQQQQRPPEDSPGKIKVVVELINLFAVVRDDKKRILGDLAQEEFRVFEDELEQKIAFFSRESKLPVTMGVLMDTSGSMERILHAEQNAASRFLARVMRKGDLAFVISFDSNVDLLSDMTEDHDRLERAIQSARVNAPSAMGPVQQRGGGTNLYDAIYLACYDKLAGEFGRKAIVLLTDAEDTGSRKSLENAIEAAQRTDTVLHVLFIEDVVGFGGGRPGVARKLAEETGGRMIGVSNEKDLERAFDQLSEELRTQYTLSYYPTNPVKDGKYRKVKVETTRKDTRVLTRKGYYASRN